MTKTTATNNAEAAAAILLAISPQIELNPERPSAEWSLDELGKFAFTSLGRSAESLWEAGRAMTLAKEKNKGKFGKWTKQYLPEISQSTITRAMKVGRLDFDDVKGKKVGEVYKMFEGGDGSKSTKKTITIKPPAERAMRHLAALSNLLDSDADDVLLANRDVLVQLNERITKLLIGEKPAPRTSPPKG